MTSAPLAHMGRALFGNLWQSRLALGRSDRIVRRWLAGKYPVPEREARRIVALVNVEPPKKKGMPT